MSRKKNEQLIRNAVFRNIRKEPDWFDLIKKVIISAMHNKNIEFSKFVQELIIDCQKHHAESVEEAIKEMVEKLNQPDDEKSKDEKKQREAILNDTHRKQLFKKLFELYANSLPIVLKKENGDIICSYSDEVEETAEKIRELIRLRDNQIFKALA